MENENTSGKLSDFLFSDNKRKIILAGVWCVGLFLIIISFLRNLDYDQLIIALGVSLFISIPIGFFVGNKIGWPLGLWVGLIGGLIIAPLVALLLGDSVSAYYASFFGPVFGALVGRWTEWNDKKGLEEDMDRISK